MRVVTYDGVSQNIEFIFAVRPPIQESGDLEVYGQRTPIRGKGAGVFEMAGRALPVFAAQFCKPETVIHLGLRDLSIPEAIEVCLGAGEVSFTYIKDRTGDPGPDIVGILREFHDADGLVDG
jgi:hypothetical protein